MMHWETMNILDSILTDLLGLGGQSKSASHRYRIHCPRHHSFDGIPVVLACMPRICASSTLIGSTALCINLPALAPASSVLGDPNNYKTAYYSQPLRRRSKAAIDDPVSDLYIAESV